MTRLARCLTLVFALIAPVLPGVALALEDKVIPFAEEDPVMNAAIQKARDSLAVFWTAFEAKSPVTSSFSLKVAVTDANGTEHFWTRDVERSGGVIHAVIDNEAMMVKSVALGQRIEVPEADISDWVFVRNGKLVGGETIRVILDQMSPEERAASGLEFETP